MKIDWLPSDSGHRQWTVWDIETGAKLATADHIIIQVPCELVNTDNNLHGYLIVNGVMRVIGENRIIIEREKEKTDG